MLTHPRYEGRVVRKRVFGERATWRHPLPAAGLTRLSGFRNRTIFLQTSSTASRPESKRAPTLESRNFLERFGEKVPHRSARCRASGPIAAHFPLATAASSLEPTPLQPRAQARPKKPDGTQDLRR